jgi:predicted phage replisome organizer
MINMCERKYIKFRVDMLSDTKSKIIDMKPERDLIHYVWTALVLLAGKVNLEGDLYMSKSIPYTIETLAIEFNRGTYQIKLSLDVLMELEMIELTENNIYRVKNFVKHQNIKVKEKNKPNDKEIKIKDNEVEENPINEAPVNGNKVSENKEGNVKENDICNLEISHNVIDKIHDNMSDNNLSYDNISNSQGTIQIPSKNNKNKRSNKNKKKEANVETIDEDVGEEMGGSFYEGDEGRPLGERESVIMAWSF